MNKRLSKFSAKTELYHKNPEHQLQISVSEFDIDQVMKKVSCANGERVVSTKNYVTKAK
jgi:hypothetical protein